MAVNLLPSHVPIGYVDNDVKKPIYASKELLRAFDSLMLHVGGQSTPAVGDVTGLSAVPIVGGIRISGTLPNNPRLKEVQLWMGTTNVLATASMITSGIASTYDKTNLLPTDGARYFWVLCVDMANNKGNFVGPVSATAGGADWQTQVTGAGKPSNYADVTTTVLTNAATSIAMNSTNLLKSLNGLAGVTIGSGGIVGRDSAGNATFTLDAATGAAAFNGTITGGANIDITGQAKFGGNFTGSTGDGVAMQVNAGSAATFGIFSKAGSGGGAAGVWGYSNGSGTIGVLGESNSGSGTGIVGRAGALSASGAIGVQGESLIATGVGVSAVNSYGGTALAVTGKMTIDNTTKVANLNADLLDGNDSTAFATSGHNHAGVYLPVAGTAAAAAQISNSGHTYTFSGGSVTGTATATFSSANKPGANSSNIWLAFVIDGTTYYAPAWPA